ncbi:hypothetical protein [Halalkalibacterium ligniniphilum]|uniref:hypothetical protein n=1 Tax=Halalkalibacterium ligniniphilum TaxID=1134413 RepID=UPI0003460FAD|nr:hypothetical protein [Halalkalibacterium ligniniphilum]
MFKKPSILLIILSAFTVGFFLSLIPKHDQLNETLIFFPLDPDAFYTEAKTSLDFLTSKDADEYILKWNVKSLLNQTSYLRQDVSLLFEDGYLKDTLSLWKEDADLIQLEKGVFGEDSGHYEAITLHHAEIHYPNDVLKSAQMMSFDQLYVFDSPLSSFHAFKIPETTEEEEGKRILDYILQQQMTFLKGDLLEHFSIPSASYESIPLSRFARFQNESLANG